MKTIEIIIPTRNRLEKLNRTIRTIPEEAAGARLAIVVICDADTETTRAMARESRVARCILVPEHSGSVHCRNLATRMTEGDFIYATDDVAFEPGAFTAAIEAMAEHFPDGDGIVGFMQIGGGKYSPAGVALVGQRFLQRYPNKLLFYPGYFHFSAQEIEFAGIRLNKLHLEKKAGLVHFHPKTNRAERDETHIEARKHRQADLALSNARQAAGLIWGLTDFNIPPIFTRP